MAKGCVSPPGSREGCEHLLEYRAKHGLRGYRAVERCLRITSAAGGRVAVRGGEEAAACATCGKGHGGRRLYACLVCAAVACWLPPESLHARLHARAAPGHSIAVDVDRAELFCCLCNDQVYDRDFDAVVLFALAAARGAVAGGGVNRGSERKKRRMTRVRVVEYRPWAPGAREKLLLLRGSVPLGESEGLPCGLRGLNNLGNTCFMNSVLQALLHTPPLRNYFLSDRHNRNICGRKGEGQGQQGVCLACDMDEIFSAAFSGERRPYSPAQFLYSWWQRSANLASYEQQDAHEFFISMIDGIHANDGREHASHTDEGDLTSGCWGGHSDINNNFC